MEKIDLKVLYDSTRYELKDFTKYKVCGLKEYSIEFQDLLVKWISLDDEKADEFDVLEDNEYYSEEKGILLTGPYCGKCSAIIKNGENLLKEITINIKSRFDGITLCEIKNMLSKCVDMKKEWDSITNNNSVTIENEKTELYYMPSLYEVYVRQRIREVLKPEWCLSDLLSKKPACKGKMELCKTNGEYISDNKAEIYLQGELIPDVILKHTEGASIEYRIYDVKYKTGQFNEGTRSDRHQILAYAYMWGCKYIGHIFPEKNSEGWVKINNGSLEPPIFYREVSCNCGSDNLAEIMTNLNKQ